MFEQNKQVSQSTAENSATSTTSVIATAEAPNQAATAESSEFIVSPASGATPLAVHFTIPARFTCPAGNLSCAAHQPTYIIDYGDGTNSLDGRAYRSGSDLDHTYTAAGSYTATLTDTTDNKGSGGPYPIIGSVTIKVTGDSQTADWKTYTKETASYSNVPYIITAASVWGQNFVMIPDAPAHIWGNNKLVDGTSKPTTVFIGGTQVSALPPTDMSNSSGFNFVVPSSLVVGESYDLYISNTNGASNVVKVRIINSGPMNQDVPVVFRVSPTPVKVGEVLTVYGANLYSTIFSLDGLYGTEAVYQDPSGASFNFVVPEKVGIGVHKLQVLQRVGESTLGTSEIITFTVAAQ